ncbi:CoA transferase subunit A [Gordonia sp. CPCC 206044]|uniref:CoA transferase subunit A n=1 Tax=Gordonia sp. CPCC 206044 TaxID=3140793 RepID=UPI003AF39CE0
MTDICATASEAVADINTGASLVVGGFGLAGIPDQLIRALADGTATDLEVISNNCGIDGHGLGILLDGHRIRRVTASYVGGNREFSRQYLAGELEVELIPQGTLAEKMRAGGAGIPAFFTPAGVGTPIAEGGLPWRYRGDGTVAVASAPKEVRAFDGAWGGKRYVLEESVVADFALVHAIRGDTDGNLVFNKAAMNFNPLAATAGRTCIAQVEELVPAGQIDPGAVHLPGIYVDRLVCTGIQHKTIERLTTAAPGRAPR